MVVLGLEVPGREMVSILSHGVGFAVPQEKLRMKKKR